ncbi:hypothetical protein QMZ30_06485 [Pantoea sp. EA-12]|uniref:hypothetical protein n=1 Tax=Pantoea sp. EA-12 TaxID=3043303 RepID=UPI0024B4AAA4|nr:hypothetical protein [Pantoea sp. EA-12]MDI9220545.1 hypothetical protein [Pantoea sp. EA-12]
MTLAMMNTHKAYKSLQQAGIEDRQAEALVEIFAEMQQENALTKSDLSQAMGSLVRAQSDTNHRIDKLDIRIAQFEKEVRLQFQGIEQRFDANDKVILSFRERFDKIDAEFVKIYDKFDKIDAEFIKINERFVKIDEKFAKIDERFVKIDERFDKIDERFAKIDERFVKIDEKFAKIDEKFAKIDEKFAKIDERFDRIDEKFAKIDEKFEQIDLKFIKMDARISDLDQRMQIGFAELKRDNIWFRRLLLGMTTATVLAAAKYIFVG